MRKLAFFLIVAATLTSCFSYEEEIRPRYDNRDRFVGHFEVEEYSKTYREFVYYNIHISKSGYDGNEVLLRDFYAEHTDIFAYVNGDRIDIPLQVSNGYEIEGSGYIHARELHLDYRVYNLYGGPYIDYCEAVAFR
jgi:hypothetical protein